MKTFQAGWYFLSNTKTAHYFEQKGKPVCNRQRVGTLTTEQPSTIRREKMTKFMGGCAACLRALHEKA
jgi:hypothetical protein